MRDSKVNRIKNLKFDLEVLEGQANDMMEKGQMEAKSYKEVMS